MRIASAELCTNDTFAVIIMATYMDDKQQKKTSGKHVM